MPQTPFDFAGQWRPLSAELRAGIDAWRLQHPKATRREMEGAVNERLAVPASQLA